MSDPTFWDDPDKAREISQEATQLKNAVESYKQLVSDIEDANVMLEMAIEEMIVLWKVKSRIMFNK